MRSLIFGEELGRVGRIGGSAGFGHCGHWLL